MLNGGLEKEAVSISILLVEIVSITRTSFKVGIPESKIGA